MFHALTVSCACFVSCKRVTKTNECPFTALSCSQIVAGANRTCWWDSRLHWLWHGSFQKTILRAKNGTALCRVAAQSFASRFHCLVQLASELNWLGCTTNGFWGASTSLANGINANAFHKSSEDSRSELRISLVCSFGTNSIHFPTVLCNTLVCKKNGEMAPNAWQKITRGAVSESFRIQILAASAVAWYKQWKIV